MKHIIVGTDREDSNSLKVALIIKNIYRENHEEVELIDLREVKQVLSTGPHYGKTQPDELLKYLNKVLCSDGLIVVAPEYNGSMPGILKYFIDHLKFPEAFESRPVCFVGLGGMFGGLRPVEHLQQIFGYRNAFIYPNRVFMINVWEKIKGQEIQDPKILDLLVKQVLGFQKFTKALGAAKIDANSILAR